MDPKLSEFKWLHMDIRHGIGNIISISKRELPLLRHAETHDDSDLLTDKWMYLTWFDLSDYYTSFDKLIFFFTYPNPPNDPKAGWRANDKDLTCWAIFTQNLVHVHYGSLSIPGVTTSISLRHGQIVGHRCVEAAKQWQHEHVKIINQPISSQHSGTCF